MLFGPLDAGVVKKKFNEIVRDAKEKRDLELSPFGTLGLAQQERDRSERKDRDHQTLTLTALLASNAAYREAHERQLDAIGDAGRAIEDAINKLEGMKAENRKAMETYLLTTARLPDGRYVMADQNGKFWDQNDREVSAEDAETAVGEKRAREPYKARRDFDEALDKGLARLGVMEAENGTRHVEATDDKHPESLERKEKVTSEALGAKDEADDWVAKMGRVSNELQGLEKLQEPGGDAIASTANIGKLILPSAGQ